MRTIVLIPAYEPDKSLAALVKQLKENHCDVVIVDDGSSKEHESVFYACREEAVILRHHHNKGKGAALKTGMRMIAREVKEAAVVVTADCDGQHTVKDILHCAETARLYNDSLIIGKRNFKLENVPKKSRMGNQITARLFTLVTGMHIEDTQSGLRAFSTDFINDWLKVKGKRYEYETNVLLYAADHHIPVKETEIETVYLDQNRSSHFHVLRDSLLISSQLLKFALSSLSSFFIDYAFFLIFHKLLGSILIANVLARFISAGENYMINRNVVFHHEGSWQKSLLQYAALAMLILGLNSCILLFFTDVLQLRASAAKIITECIMFVFSWTIQHTFIFRSAEKAS